MTFLRKNSKIFTQVVVEINSIYLLNCTHRHITTHVEFSMNLEHEALELYNSCLI